MYKNSGEILFEWSSEHRRVYIQFTSNLHGEILNFFYLYTTRVTDPLPLLYLYIVKIDDFHQILTAFLIWTVLHINRSVYQWTVKVTNTSLTSNFAFWSKLFEKTIYALSEMTGSIYIRFWYATTKHKWSFQTVLIRKQKILSGWCRWP